MRTRINAETGEEEDALKRHLTTPEPHFRLVVKTAVEAARRSGEAAAATADADRGMRTPRRCRGRGAGATPRRNRTTRPAVEGEAEGEAVEPAEEGMTDADAMSHRTKDGAYSVSVSNAMNGQDFSPFTTEFAYQDPTLEERESPVK